MPEETKVYRVTNVDVAILKRLPPELAVEADGETTTGGWTSPELSRRQYVVPPRDGIQEFAFLATPPTSNATQEVTPVHASYVMDNIPQWLQGVRVIASENSEEATISSPLSEIQER